MQKGIIRTLDHHNKITVPREILREVGISGGDYVQLELETDSRGRTRVAISHKEGSCVLCGSSADTEWHNKMLCHRCISELLADFPGTSSAD